jgi:uncharacterized surface protein with fasciclin (FAS1) repeats
MQFIRKTSSLIVGAAVLALSAPAMADHHNEASANIVETAVSNDQFSTLVAAVQAADLVGTLSGEGPFTVFAPTNDAFAALPEGTVPTLLEPANKGTLTTVLTYHVVPGKIMASDLVGMISDNDGPLAITTVAGATLMARIENGMVVLTDAAGNDVTVTATDVDTSNGVIHVLDGVLLPG